MRSHKPAPRISPEVKKRQRKCQAARLSRKRHCEAMDELCSYSRLLAGAYVCVVVQPCKKIKDLKVCPGKRV